MKLFNPLVFAVFATLSLNLTALHAAPPVSIDEQGVMRWTDSGDEIALFGVNYSVPFAHGYRAINYVGADHETAIDNDVYHFARLGLGAYRIHVWDIEISDRQGNLVENDHLRLLDYLIHRLKERGIKIVLTTMRNADNAYPEGDEVLGWGFSRYYPKYGDIAHHTPDAIAAQQRYVQGFLNHVNPYTELSYKDDQDILAFEINNEPHHTDDVESVKDYLRKMVSAMRETGLEKPIFYNMSHNFDVTEAFLIPEIQGGTFQWYPTGLNAGFTQKGNFLPNVDNYRIPFSDHPDFQDKAKLVYEFSSADVGDSYLYPAMVRAFREQGFQFITQFAYDPMATAHMNSEYKTHYLNLAYTPAKAISFKIAGEVARSVPRGQDYGTHPENTAFENFRVSYEEDLAEMVADEAFYYSNTTKNSPKNAGKLEKLAGVGSSPLVQYEGQGAYFLDKLDTGVWRLEVMPDAVIINDPFDDPHIDKTVSRIEWNQWPMTVSLPDLGSDFTFRGINDGNVARGRADGKTFVVSPGVYLLARNGASTADWDRNRTYENILIGEYVAPPSTGVDRYDAVHSAQKETSSGKPLVIAADIVGSRLPASAEIRYATSSTGEIRPAPTMLRFPTKSIPMLRTSGYRYEAEIPAEELSADGGVMYFIVVNDQGKISTFPGNADSEPGAWDYHSDAYWATRIVAPDSPLQLLNPDDDFNYVLPLSTRHAGGGQKSLIKGSAMGSKALRIEADITTENRHFLREYIGFEIEGRRDDLSRFTRIAIRGRALNKASETLQMGLLTTDGFTYAAPLKLSGNWQTITIPLGDFRQTDTGLRLAYPQMMNTHFTPEIDIPFNIETIENWEVAVPSDFKSGPLAYEVEIIWLE